LLVKVQVIGSHGPDHEQLAVTAIQQFPEKPQEFSLEECRYYLILIQDLGYGATTDMGVLPEEVSRLLVAYAKAIESHR
jgi:hypothetical protein